MPGEDAKTLGRHIDRVLIEHQLSAGRISANMLVGLYGFSLIDTRLILYQYLTYSLLIETQSWSSTKYRSILRRPSVSRVSVNVSVVYSPTIPYFKALM